MVDVGAVEELCVGYLSEDDDLLEAELHLILVHCVQQALVVGQEPFTSLLNREVLIFTSEQRLALGARDALLLDVLYSPVKVGCWKWCCTWSIFSLYTVIYSLRKMPLPMMYSQLIRSRRSRASIETLSKVYLHQTLAFSEDYRHEYMVKQERRLRQDGSCSEVGS